MTRADLQAIKAGDSVLGDLFGEPDECEVTGVGPGYVSGGHYVRETRVRRGGAVLPISFVEGGGEMLAVRV
jgi:hypothetical protein